MNQTLDAKSKWITKQKFGSFFCFSLELRYSFIPTCINWFFSKIHEISQGFDIHKNKFENSS